MTNTDKRPVGKFPYKCEACGRDDIMNPATHESIQHDGAQTCWPVKFCANCSRQVRMISVELNDEPPIYVDPDGFYTCEHSATAIVVTRHHTTDTCDDTCRHDQKGQ